MNKQKKESQNPKIGELWVWNHYDEKDIKDIRFLFLVVSEPYLFDAPQHPQYHGMVVDVMTLSSYGARTGIGIKRFEYVANLRNVKELEGNLK